MTPNIAIVQVQATHWHIPRLWLPLFLLWIPLIVLAPFILLVLAAACFAFRVSLWRTISVFWSLISALPGTDVRVSADGTHVLVKIL